MGATTTSIWSAETGEAATLVGPLADDVSVDVCVVGSGIAGLMIAHRLASAGRVVAVLDQRGLLAGETRQSTAHVTLVLDSGYSRLEAMYGAEKNRDLAYSHAAAISLIEKLVAEENVDCDFRRVDGFLYDTSNSAGESSLEQEWQAARRAGVECELVQGAPLPYVHGRALRFPGQAQLDPVRFGHALVRAILGRGSQVYAPARVVSLEKESGSGIRVRTRSGRTVRANDVVIATNVPINDVVTMHTKQAPYRTYALAAPIPLHAIEPGLYWDREEPYHYVRTARARDKSLAEGYEWLIVGGEDHKVGQDSHPESRWERLAQWLGECFARAGAPIHRWSGQVVEPADGIAFIGRNPGDEHVFIATGHSGNGISYGAISAILIGDLIAGRENDWSSLYDPARKPASGKALAKYVRENLNVARRYGDWLVQGDVARVEEIARGDGAVIRRGLKKVAVYVDEQGRAHELSAKCPHMGCVVAWNRAEKSWDCPCHGSRFDAHGRVLAGPAVRDLEPVDQSIGEPAVPRANH